MAPGRPPHARIGQLPAPFLFAQSSSSSRFTAGAFEFFISSESGERPERWAEAAPIHAVPTLLAWETPGLFARAPAASGSPLPVQPLHLLGKQQPAARHFFECAFYGRAICLRGTILGLGRSMSVLIRP